MNKDPLHLRPLSALLFLVGVLLLCPIFCRGETEPQFSYFDTNSQSEAIVRVLRWCARPGHFQSKCYGDSMKPWFTGGDNEYHLQEKVTEKTPLYKGQVVIYDRGESVKPVSHHCEHMIDDISKDGQYLHLTGTNNRYSDGWHPRSKVTAVLREVVRIKT